MPKFNKDKIDEFIKTIPETPYEEISDEKPKEINTAEEAQKEEPASIEEKEKESVSKKMMMALQKKALEFKEKPEWLNKLINLSEEIYYLTYLDKKDEKREKIFTENYFRNEWPNSLYALAGRKIPIELLIELCENGTITDPSKPFTEEELSGEIGEIKAGEETIKDLCKKQKEEVALTLEGIKNSIRHNKKEGLDLEKTRIGNMIYQDYFIIAGKVNKILNHLAYIVTRIKNYDAFASFNTKERSFFIQAKDLEALKNLSEEFNEKFPGCAVLVENAMIHGKIIDNMTEEEFLNIIDPKILEGKNKVSKKEKQEAERNVATPDISEPEIAPEEKNTTYENQKENIEKRKEEAEKLHNNSVLTAGDNGFVVKESKSSYEIAKDLRSFIQKQATANQTGVIYKFKDGDNIYNYAISTYDAKRGAGIGYVGYSVKVDKDTLLTDEEIYEILENNLNAAFDQKFPNKETWETDKDTHISSIEKNNFEKIKAKYEIELAELDKKYNKNQEKNSGDNQSEEDESKMEDLGWTEKDEIERQKLIDEVQRDKVELAKLIEMINQLPNDEERKNEEEETIKQNEDKNENLSSKKQIPVATEIFNEERSIKDSSGNIITIGDTITQNGTNYLVIGFFEQKIEPRYIKPGGKEYKLYAELVEINKGKVNFNSRSAVLDGEGILKEKWQPKYNNGEIIKLGDIVTANVEKHFFEIYNKKLKIIGFSLDGRIDIEVIENGFRRPVLRELLNIVDETKENKIEGSYTTIGYADVILDGKLKTKYISSAPREDTVFEILKDKNGNIKLGIWKGAEKRVLKNPDFLDGTEKMKIKNKPTQINVELGDLQKDDEGGYRLIKKPVVKLIDESYKG